MKSTILFSVIILLIPAIQYAMDNTQSKRDVFSQLPNTIRKKIVFPLLKQPSSLDTSKNILMSIGLVSKKSYEQISCPFFVRDTIALLGKKLCRNRGFIAALLNTKGTRHYNTVGNKLITVLLQNQPNAECQAFKKLLSQGADINFETALCGTTPLMKAVELTNKKIVCLCLLNNAHIDTYHNSHFARESSFLYRNSITTIDLETCITYLMYIQNILQENEKPSSVIKHVLYNHAHAQRIRDAFLIDTLLKSMGGKTKKELFHDVLTPLYKKIPNAQKIIMIITNQENKQDEELFYP